jgi:hypothetical protein
MDLGPDRQSHEKKAWEGDQGEGERSGMRVGARVLSGERP